MTGYIVNSDFRVGVDRRRSRIAGTPGSLWIGKNIHLTRGGEAEKRKRFVPKWDLPPKATPISTQRTYGLRVIDGEAYIFGSEDEATIAPDLPAGVNYQRLQHPSGSPIGMTALLSHTLFDGKIYAVAEFASGFDVQHYYDGQRVRAWDDGVVTSWDSTLEEMALQLAARINDHFNEPDSDAVAFAGADGTNTIVTIVGKENNVSFTVTAEAENVTGGVNDQTATAVRIQTATALLPDVWTVTLGGTPEEGDRFSIRVHNTEYGAGDNPATKGRTVMTFRSKIYAIAGGMIYFCAVGDPLTWRANIDGAGFINAATHEGGSLDLVGIGKYQGSLAFFADNAIQIWNMDEDPANNVLLDTLDNTGAVAGGSILQYGNNDTFYLARSGLRSLRARDATDAAFVTDPGNPIDSLLVEAIRELGPDAANAKAILDPTDGRYWLALDDRIYVLSYFPGAKITAWSWYEPGFTIDDFSIDSGKIYVRSGDTVYLYAGDDGNTYDISGSDYYEAVVELPFQSTKRTADDKVIVGYDLAITGTWLVKALTDPRNENRYEVLGTVDEITYPDKAYAASGLGSHVAMAMTCTSPGPASVNHLALWLDEEASEQVR